VAFSATIDISALLSWLPLFFNPDSEKTPLKVVPSLAQILLKNGDFTEEALGSTFKNRL